MEYSLDCWRAWALGIRSKDAFRHASAPTSIQARWPRHKPPPSFPESALKAELQPLLA